MKLLLVILMTVLSILRLSNVNASEKVKNIIREEFRYIKELLDFDKESTRDL